MSLWRLYQFNYLPIELISHIYEDFNCVIHHVEGNQYNETFRKGDNYLGIAFFFHGKLVV